MDSNQWIETPELVKYWRPIQHNKYWFRYSNVQHDPILYRAYLLYYLLCFRKRGQNYMRYIQSIKIYDSFGRTAGVNETRKRYNDVGPYLVLWSLYTGYSLSRLGCVTHIPMEILIYESRNPVQISYGLILCMYCQSKLRADPKVNVI